jgi:hypothetical protein
VAWEEPVVARLGDPGQVNNPDRVSVRMLVIASLLATYLLTTARPASTPLSHGEPTTASTTENADTPTTAPDGNPRIRWSSAFADPPWVQVALGATAAVDW